MYPAFLGLLLLSLSTSLANAHETTARCCPNPDRAQQKLFQLSLDAAQMSDASVSLSAVDGDRDGYFARNDRAYFEKMQSLRELLKRHNEVYSLCVSPEIEQPISNRLQIYTRANYSNLPNPNVRIPSKVESKKSYEQEIFNIYGYFRTDRDRQFDLEEYFHECFENYRQKLKAIKCTSQEPCSNDLKSELGKCLDSVRKNQPQSTLSADEYAIKYSKSEQGYFSLWGDADLNTKKSRLLISYFYKKLLSVKSDKNISQVNAAAMSRLSVPERDLFLNFTLNRLEDRYDQKRANSNLKAVGSVTGIQLLNNLEKHENNNDSFDPFNRAGVCRDIHLFGARMAKELGFGKPLVVSYTTRGDPHANLIYHDPSDPLRVTRSNYGNVTRLRGGDVRSLYDGADDIAIEYGLWNPDGSPAKSVLSEFGKQMFSFAGADPTTIDPLSENRSSVFGVTLPSTTGKSTSRLAIGQDGNGVVSAALTEAYLPNDTSKVSLSLGTNHAQDNAYLESRTVNTDFIFAYLEKNFKSKDQQWTENISSRLEALTQTYLMAGRTRVAEQPSTLNFQGGSFLTLKAVTEKKVSSSVPGVKTELGVQTFPAIRDISNAYWKQIPVLAMNHFFWTAEGRTLLSQSPEGRAFMLAKLTLLFDSLGAKARYEAGIVSDKRGGITASIQGRIYGAAYTDGTRRKTGIAAHLNPNDWLKIGAYSLVDLETQKTEKREINLGASVAVESR